MAKNPPRPELHRQPGLADAIKRMADQWASLPDDHPLFEPGRRLLADVGGRGDSHRAQAVTASAAVSAGG